MFRVVDTVNIYAQAAYLLVRPACFLCLVYHIEISQTTTSPVLLLVSLEVRDECNEMVLECFHL